MRRLSRLLSPLLAVVIATAAVQLAPVAQAAPASDKDTLAEAQVLYNEGKVAFETADYEIALGKWKKAYGMLPDSEDARVIRHALVYNISEAQVRAYEVNRNPTHLRKAKVLLERYLAEHRAFYGDNEKAVGERSEVRDRLDEVIRMIDESEAAGETGAVPVAGGETDGGTGQDGTIEATEGPPKELTPEQRRMEEIKADPVLKKEWDKAGGGVVAGSVLLGIGVIFLGISVAATVNWASIRSDQDAGLYYDGDDLARVANGILAIACGTVGLGLTIPGVIILPKSIKTRKRMRKPTEVPTARILPYGSPYGGGVSAVLRF